MPAKRFGPVRGISVYLLYPAFKKTFFGPHQHIRHIAGRGAFGKNHLAVLGFSDTFALIGNAGEHHIGCNFEFSSVSSHRAQKYEIPPAISA